MAKSGGLAERHMLHDRPDETLQPTILVHDACVHLIDAPDCGVQHRLTGPHKLWHRASRIDSVQSITSSSKSQNCAYPKHW